MNLARLLLVQDGIESIAGHHPFLYVEAALTCGDRLFGVQGAQPRARDPIEGHRPRPGGSSHLHDHVVRSKDPQILGKCRIGLDQDPAPALLIQTRGDRQVPRLIGSDVHVAKAGRVHPTKGTPDPDVLGLLGIGDARRGGRAGIRPILTPLHVGKRRRGGCAASMRDVMRFRRQPRVDRVNTDFVSARHAELSVISSADDLEPGPDDLLIDLLIEAARAAKSVDLTPVIDRCRTQEDARYVATWPGEHYRLLPALAQVLGANRVVEVGTYIGQGTLALRQAAQEVITYDIVPASEFPTSLLAEGDFSDGIEQRIGDLSDPDYFAANLEALRQADLIFVDGPKDGVFESALADLLFPALAERGTVVVWDDIRVMTMVNVWRQFPVPKLDATSFGHWSGTGLTHG